MKVAKKYARLFLALLSLVLLYNSSKWRSSLTDLGLSDQEIVGQVDEEFYFRFEMKMRHIDENLEHRLDYLRERFKHFLLTFDSKKSMTESLISATRNFALFTRFQIEKLCQFNKYKAPRLEAYSKSIQAKLHRLQDNKCRLDRIVYTSLQQHNCGFGCNLHTLSVGLLISLYWERTLVYSKIKVPGMEIHEKIFLPIAKNCRIHNLDNTTIYKEAFHPYKVYLQVLNGEKFFRKYRRDVSQLQYYHHDPAAFYIGNLIHFIMRFNKSSSFYKKLQLDKQTYNFSHPYVGVHVRRSDKYTEANFFYPDDYMIHVEEFYQNYFLKNPDKVNTTKRIVYIASDEEGVFQQFVTMYPSYNFVFDNNFTDIAGSQDTRYTPNGYLSLLKDFYFLSRADYLVCTFSSNICRLAYEILAYRFPAAYKLVTSLDAYYHNYFEMDLHQIAVLDNLKSPNFGFKKGDIIVKEYYSGSNFDGYFRNGFSSGKLLHMKKRGGDYPSYKARDFYIP